MADLPAAGGNVARLLSETYKLFFSWAAGLVGPSMARKLAHQSHAAIESYFHNLKLFVLSQDARLEPPNAHLTDNEVLAFTVWMQQLQKEIRGLMVGLGKADPRQITAELKDRLQPLGFYEFFEQAMELHY